MAGIRIQGLESEISSLKDHHFELQQKMIKRNNEIESFKECLSEKVRLISTYKMEYQKLNEDNINISTKYDDLLEQNTKLKKSYDCLEVEYKEAKLSWLATEDSVACNENELATLQLELSKCLQLIDKNSEELFQKQAKIDQFEEILKAKETEINLKDVEYKQLVEFSNKTKETFEQKIIQYESNVKMLTDNEAKLLSQIQLQTDKIQTLTTKQENFVQLSNSIEQLEIESQQKTILIDSINRDKSLLLTKIQDLEELIQKNNELSELHLKKLKDELADSEKQKLKYADEHNSTLKQLTNLQAENEKLINEKNEVELKTKLQENKLKTVNEDSDDGTIFSRTEEGWSGSDSDITLNTIQFHKRSYIPKQFLPTGARTSDSSEIKNAKQLQKHRYTKRTATNSLSSQFEPFKQHHRRVFLMRNDSTPPEKAPSKERVTSSSQRAKD